MMKASTPAEREEAKSKRLMLGAVAMLLAAAGVFGGLSSLQRQAIPMTQAEQMARENEQSRMTPPEQLERSLERAKFLREKWRPWAEKNTGLLKTMLAAEPDDKAAMIAVWKAVPPLRLEDEKSISFKDLTPDGHSGNNHQAILSGSSSNFTWAALETGLFDPAPLPADPKKRAHVKFLQGLSDKALDFNFRAFRDISIAQSSNRGDQWISLWASGRITEAKSIDNPDRSPAASSRLREPDKELVPPYDFLQ